MDGHTVVEPVFWRYGVVEVAWLEQATWRMPVRASEQALGLLLAHGGTVQVGLEDHGCVPAPVYAAPGGREGSCVRGERFRELVGDSGWLWDGRAPLVVRPCPPGRGLLVRLPVGVLAARLGDVAVHYGLVLRTDQGSGAVCAQLLAALATQAPTLSPAQRQALGDSALDALVVWLRGEHVARAHLSPRHSEQLAAICDYIECYLDDDQLCPRTLANRFGISVRYLHRIFAPTGTSVARWIAIRRLETIRGELLQRGGSRGTIRDVATRWGFHDMAHFSRAFRQHFGEPPWSYLRRRTGHVPYMEM
mgnify:FL=1